ncbi:Hypothetical protein SRAE_2000048300 [Strongyloides ratti]|uniref:Uncharacterized protein n=1 Tax=Strongyloides ratti TaxID=34506 RepID=A0A090L7U8_STRRB|nr:Hypothetical protein SRAE_2000048300 [Strongyloides ratti]CEF65807.1 Hypothetical protein SRAE_2000048300 [Strongyloides ratti]
MCLSYYQYTRKSIYHIIILCRSKFGVLGKRFSNNMYVNNMKQLLSQELPLGIRPSDDLYQSVYKIKKSEELAILIGQLCILYKKTNKVPRVLTDNDWMKLLNMNRVKDRDIYLYDLYIKSFNKMSPKVDEKSILEENKKKNENREIVYDRNHYQLVDCYGNDFEERINLQYGNNYCSALRINETIPKIIFDCKYLYKLSLDMQFNFSQGIVKLWNYFWLNGCVFDIKMTNFLTDPALSNLIQDNFLFLYKSQGTNEENINIDHEKWMMSSGYDCPFKPTLTTKQTNFFIDKLEKSAFITPLATENLPDDISIFDTFIIAPSDEKRHRDSISLANYYNMPAFKLPVEKYYGYNRKVDKSNPFVLGKVLSSVYYKKMNWTKALSVHLSKENLKPFFESLDDKEYAEREKIKHEMVLFTRKFKKMKYSIDSKMIQAKGKIDPLTEKKIVYHKYSREERKKNFS